LIERFSLPSTFFGVHMQTYQEDFKDLVDRSLMVLVLQCEECGAHVARIIHPRTAKLDMTCDEYDHANETGHGSYNALKILIIYMNQADKDLAKTLSKAQRKALDDFLNTFKARESLRDKVIKQLREELGREPTESEIQTSLKSIDENMG